MQKTDIVTFLEQKRRGIYNVLVNEYWDSILSTTPTNLALTLIANDLEKSTGQKVTLKYVSLAQAVSKARDKYQIANSTRISSHVESGEMPSSSNASGKKKY